MKPWAKVALVVVGYAAAILIAFVAVRVHVGETSGPDRKAASNMFAFGDDLFFLAVLGIAAVPATGAALFFLRSNRTFWRIAATGALCIEATGLLALADYLLVRNPGTGPLLGSWSPLAPLRILMAPGFAILFFLSLLFAPTRTIRIAFLAAAIVETAVFAWVVLIWIRPFQ